MTKDEGLERVKELIEQFENRRKEWRSVSYKEASVRIDFIDEFFLALGWRKGTGEFKVEKSQDLENENKGSADYYFDLGAGKRFFVEAKKPSENLAEKTKHALQARRYAYSAGHPVVILTDFEEFYVYKGRGVAPKESDDAKVAIIDELSCKDFTEYPAKWGVLWNAFSRESVLAGSLETLPGVIGDKKGSTPVDRLFLSDIEKWRSLLAENIHKNNPDLNRRALNEAVQKTIDRIIFLRICEDRDIEEYGYLLNAGKAPQIYNQLCVLFRQADTRFNSGLFHFKKEKNRDDFDDISLNLIIDNEPLQTIIDRLYWPGGPYAFAAMPADILGQVYERFLGKVIEIDGESITVDDKPEVKKAGGVFYTPEYIVDYIVKSTVGRLLDACKTPSNAAKLKILDPACGSGAFLINAYQYLLNWHLSWYSANKPETHSKERRILKNVHGVWQLTLAERKRILLNNIHGVDIDSQAVEVTKLSLLLKCVEGETRSTTQMGLFDKDERVLPDLENNIKCGNSLIGSDFYDNVQGELFSTEEKLKINAFDWNEEFKDVMDNDGFDCVIGNPPYVCGSFFEEHSKSYIERIYRSYEYQLNIFSIFIEKGLNLLKKNGFISYITPAVFLAQHYFKNIRCVILECKIIHLLLLNYKVFENADTGDTCIFQISKVVPENNIINHTKVRRVEDFENLVFNFKQQSEFYLNARNEMNICIDNFFVGNLSNITTKLKNISKIIVGIKPYQKGKGVPKQTEADVKNRIFDSTNKASATFRQYLIGKDIDRYVIKPNDSRFIDYGKWLAEPRITAPFDRNKIILRQTSDKIIATLDDINYCNLNNIYNIELTNSYDLKYLLRILNSTLFVYVYQSIVPEKGRVFAEVKKVNLEQLPIRTINFDDPTEKQMHDDMVKLVTDMLKYQKELLQPGLDSQTKKQHQKDIDTTDRKIDQLVYKLYDLTPDEIKIVEGAS